MIITVSKNQQLSRKVEQKKRLCPVSSVSSLMTLETLELGRMGLLHFITFAGSVTFHTNGNVLYAAVERVTRYEWEFLSRKREKDRSDYQNKYKETNDTFHIYIVSYARCLVTEPAALFLGPRCSTLGLGRNNTTPGEVNEEQIQEAGGSPGAG